MQRTRLELITRRTLGLVAACLVLTSRPAFASIDYPALVKSHWGVKKLPVTGADGCPLCHTTDPGMLGTANQKFALTLKSFGLQSLNDNALKAALDKSKSKMSDSDGDGYSDYEELVLYSTNPDDANDHPLPMMEGGGSGTVNPSGGGSTSSPEAGTASDNMGTGAADAGADVSAGGSLGECTATEEVYPTLGHGCSIRAGSTGSNTNVPLLAGVLAACLIRRGARASKGRRERGKQI
ncbi:MAG TPA: thrombospondin type 3 repeat-containing protein [Polyangiaceae bacterium]